LCYRQPVSARLIHFALRLSRSQALALKPSVIFVVRVRRGEQRKTPLRKAVIRPSLILCHVSPLFFCALRRAMYSRI
jgi:hypothetical protein